MSITKQEVEEEDKSDVEIKPVVKSPKKREKPDSGSSPSSSPQKKPKREANSTADKGKKGKKEVQDNGAESTEQKQEEEQYSIQIPDTPPKSPIGRRRQSVTRRSRGGVKDQRRTSMPSKRRHWSSTSLDLSQLTTSTTWNLLPLLPLREHK